MEVIIAGVSTVIGLVGLFGWSHKRVSTKIEALELVTAKLLPEHRIRTLIDDKLAPLEREYRSLSRRIDELRASNKHLDHKIDSILEILRNEKAK